MQILIFLIVNLFTANANAAKLSEHVVRQIYFWKEFKDKALEAKILKAPPELIDYLKKDNEQNAWPNKPTSVDLPPDFIKDVQSAIAEIPEHLQKMISAKTVGIFLVEDLGGSAYTENIFNNKGEPFAGFVVIDKSAMNRTANDWATWKESSPFRLNSTNDLHAIIENPQNNTRKAAIQYVLLHEFGHILSIGNPLLPNWGEGLSEDKIKPDMKYFNLSWNAKGEKLLSKFDSQWDKRSTIRYYTSEEKKLKSSDALLMYQKLASTNFPTLYAATNPFDDFADSFASYVHVEILKKPWSIHISSGSKELTYSSCWKEPRCKSKKEIFEQIITQVKN
jgi:hypothetical protein